MMRLEVDWTYLILRN